MGRRGAGAQRSVAAWRRSAARQGRSGSPAARSGSPAGRGSIGAGDHRQGVAAAGSRSPAGAAASGRRDPTGRAGQQQAARSPGSRRPAAGSRSPAGRGSIGAADPPAGRGSVGAAIHRQGVAAAGSRSPGRVGQQQATDPPAAGGQGLEAAKSSRAKDESPTGILSTHVHVAAEKNFFTPRRGVILAEKRPLPARGRKPCYDFCVGRESPPAKQKLHSADHGAERISP